MNNQYKIVTGIVTIGLGLTLIGGGTWSALTCQKQMTSHFADGTLELSVIQEDNSTAALDLGLFKPGETQTKRVKLVNDGSLAIKDIWMTSSFGHFVDKGGTNTSEAFLSAFHATVEVIDGESPFVVYEGTLANLMGVRRNILAGEMIPGNEMSKTVVITVKMNDQAPQLTDLNGDAAYVNLAFEAVQGAGSSLTAK